MMPGFGGHLYNTLGGEGLSVKSVGNVTINTSRDRKKSYRNLNQCHPFHLNFSIFHFLGKIQEGGERWSTKKIAPFASLRLQTHSVLPRLTR